MNAWLEYAAMTKNTRMFADITKHFGVSSQRCPKLQLHCITLLSIINDEEEEYFDKAIEILWQLYGCIPHSVPVYEFINLVLDIKILIAFSLVDNIENMSSLNAKLRELFKFTKMNLFLNGEDVTWIKKRHDKILQLMLNIMSDEQQINEMSSFLDLKHCHCFMDDLKTRVDYFVDQIYKTCGKPFLEVLYDLRMKYKAQKEQKSSKSLNHTCRNETSSPTSHQQNYDILPEEIVPEKTNSATMSHKDANSTIENKNYDKESLFERSVGKRRCFETEDEQQKTRAFQDMSKSLGNDKDSGSKICNSKSIKKCQENVFEGSENVTESAGKNSSTQDVVFKRDIVCFINPLDINKISPKKKNTTRSPNKNSHLQYSEASTLPNNSCLSEELDTSAQPFRSEERYESEEVDEEITKLLTVLSHSHEESGSDTNERETSEINEEMMVDKEITNLLNELSNNSEELCASEQQVEEETRKREDKNEEGKVDKEITNLLNELSNNSEELCASEQQVEEETRKSEDKNEEGKVDIEMTNLLNELSNNSEELCASEQQVEEETRKSEDKNEEGKVDIEMTNLLNELSNNSEELCDSEQQVEEETRKSEDKNEEGKVDIEMTNLLDELSNNSEELCDNEQQVEEETRKSEDKNEEGKVDIEMTNLLDELSNNSEELCASEQQVEEETRKSEDKNEEGKVDKEITNLLNELSNNSEELCDNEQQVEEETRKIEDKNEERKVDKDITRLSSDLSNDSEESCASEQQVEEQKGDRINYRENKEQRSQDGGTIEEQISKVKKTSDKHEEMKKTKEDKNIAVLSNNVRDSCAGEVHNIQEAPSSETSEQKEAKVTSDYETLSLKRKKNFNAHCQSKVLPSTDNTSYTFHSDTIVEGNIPNIRAVIEKTTTDLCSEYNTSIPHKEFSVSALCNEKSLCQKRKRDDENLFHLKTSQANKKIHLSNVDTVVVGHTDVEVKGEKTYLYICDKERKVVNSPARITHHTADAVNDGDSRNRELCGDELHDDNQSCSVTGRLVREKEIPNDKTPVLKCNEDDHTVAITTCCQPNERNALPEKLSVSASYNEGSLCHKRKRDNEHSLKTSQNNKKIYLNNGETVVRHVDVEIKGGKTYMHIIYDKKKKDDKTPARRGFQKSSMQRKLEKKQLEEQKMLEKMEVEEYKRMKEHEKKEELKKQEESRELHEQGRVEEQGILEVLRKVEKLRKLEEQKTLEERRRLEVLKNVEELKNREESRILEELRKLKELRKDEEQMKLEEQRRLEELRKLEEMDKFAERGKQREVRNRKNNSAQRKQRRRVKSDRKRVKILGKTHTQDVIEQQDKHEKHMKFKDELMFVENEHLFDMFKGISNDHDYCMKICKKASTSSITKLCSAIQLIPFREAQPVTHMQAITDNNDNRGSKNVIIAPDPNTMLDIASAPGKLYTTTTCLPGNGHNSTLQERNSTLQEKNSALRAGPCSEDSSKMSTSAPQTNTHSPSLQNLDTVQTSIHLEVSESSRDVSKDSSNGTLQDCTASMEKYSECFENGQRLESTSESTNTTECSEKSDNSPLETSTKLGNDFCKNLESESSAKQRLKWKEPLKTNDDPHSVHCCTTVLGSTTPPASSLEISQPMEITNSLAESLENTAFLKCPGTLELSEKQVSLKNTIREGNTVSTNNVGTSVDDVVASEEKERNASQEIEETTSVSSKNEENEKEWAGDSHSLISDQELNKDQHGVISPSLRERESCMLTKNSADSSLTNIVTCCVIDSQNRTSSKEQFVNAPNLETSLSGSGIKEGLHQNNKTPPSDDNKNETSEMAKNNSHKESYKDDILQPVSDKNKAIYVLSGPMSSFQSLLSDHRSTDNNNSIDYVPSSQYLSSPQQTTILPGLNKYTTSLCHYNDEETQNRKIRLKDAVIRIEKI